LGSPPAAFSLSAKNLCISLPVTILACFAAAMFTLFEFGVASTELSGFAQVPALGAEVWRFLA
jgi:hypothetical protein